MEYRATQKFILTSPKKLREVAALVRKITPSEALNKLPFVGKKAARVLEKVIREAIANAQQKGASVDELVFKEIQVNEGPRLKRYRAGARGRVKPYKRRMSHVRVVVVSKTQTQENKGQKLTQSKKINPILSGKKPIKKGGKKGEKTLDSVPKPQH